MGYTHYWRKQSNKNEAKWAQVLKDCAKICKHKDVKPLLAGWDGTGKSDFSDGVIFNGVGDEGHETFSLPADFNKLQDFDFCKTARKEYDIAVVACLCVVDDLMNGSVMVSSDGYPDEWEDGRKLASEILKRELKVPSTIE